VKLDVITAGEPLVLLAAQQYGALEGVESFARVCAGAELNVSIGLSRLGLRTGYISRVGSDSFGRFLTQRMVQEGVDVRHVSVDSDHRTGFMLKSRTEDGSDPHIEYFRKSSAASHMGPRDLQDDICEGVRHLHLTGIYVGVSESTRELIFKLAALARQAGLTISFDPNLRPSLWPSASDMVRCLNQLAFLSDWIFPGLAEGQMLTGFKDSSDIADFYLERGATKVVIKLGPEGAYYASAAERGVVPGIRVRQVVDTVGAGDGFAAGVIAGLLRGLSLPDATLHGNAIGARVVQFPGDSDGLPTLSELNAFLSGAGQHISA
jgi:2-dehydro-3-deoxygluconokinase